MCDDFTKKGSYSIFSIPGKYCEATVDYCKSSPCKNQATCVNRRDNYMCVCVPGYTGKNCHLDVDECSSDPCNSNGTKSCKDGINSFTCNCKPGYAGLLCEESKFHNV